ncbi:MAG: hypothetical protein JO083_00300 [Candidatus Eremiobacteraeota bacterium]|nr:hypothetical protein [Candidatus Eremiobacteraeota bacterium]
MRVHLTAALAVVLAAGALMIPASARASGEGQFRTPSGNIGCAYYERVLRCDVRDGVRPLPPQPPSCQLDWGQGFWLHEHGAAHIVCAGDTALNPTASVVRYGTTWQGGRISCTSSPSGLRCTNADRHGFFLSRGEAYRF